MKTIVLILMLLSINQLSAQNNFVTGGNTLINNFGSVSFSMGQINHLHVETSTSFISEGVQQAIETIDHIGFSHLEFQNNFSLYPNPATSKVYVQFDDTMESPVLLTIRDVSGRIIENKELNSSISELKISHLPEGIYYLTITSNLQSSTFTLIKK